MKKITARSIVAILTLLGSLSSSSIAAELDEHLLFLQPYIGEEWVGGYVGEDAPDLEILLRFEPILDGKAVRYSRDAKAAEFAGVTHFYWNQSLGKVSFLNLNNRGIMEEGIVESEDGGVVLHGNSHWSDETVEFKTMLKIGENGTLSDTLL